MEALAEPLAMLPFVDSLRFSNNRVDARSAELLVDALRRSPFGSLVQVSGNRFLKRCLIDYLAPFGGFVKKVIE